MDIVLTYIAVTIAALFLGKQALRAIKQLRQTFSGAGKCSGCCERVIRKVS